MCKDDFIHSKSYNTSFLNSFITKKLLKIIDDLGIRWADII